MELLTRTGIGTSCFSEFEKGPSKELLLKDPSKELLLKEPEEELLLKDLEEELLLKDPSKELLLKAFSLLKTPHTPRT